MNAPQERRLVRFGLLVIAACANAAVALAAVAVLEAINAHTMHAALLGALAVLNGTIAFGVGWRLRAIERRRLAELGLGVTRQRYTYTAGVAYDEAQALAAARRARTRTASGRPYRPGGGSDA